MSSFVYYIERPKKSAKHPADYEGYDLGESF